MDPGLRRTAWSAAQHPGNAGQTFIGIAQAVAMVIGNSTMTGQTIVLNGGTAFI
jgi:hypothetical protein